MAPFMRNEASMRGALLASSSLLTAVLATACGGLDESSVVGNIQAPPDGELAGTVGVFLYRHTSSEGSVFETALTASFQGASGDSCTTIEEGMCTRKDCVWMHGTADESKAHAGRISATSGGRTLFVEPEPSGPYRAKFDEGALWEDAGPIVVEASGGMIPPFRVQLLGPAETTVAEPPPPSPDSRLLIKRDAPFLLTWRAAEVGKTLGVLSYQSGDQYSTVTCAYPASAGEGAIPAGLLDGFNPEGAPMRLSIGIGQSQLVDVDGWLVDVVAYTSATTETFGDASYSLRFQQ